MAHQRLSYNASHVALQYKNIPREMFLVKLRRHWDPGLGRPGGRTVRFWGSPGIEDMTLLLTTYLLLFSIGAHKTYRNTKHSNFAPEDNSQHMMR